MEEELPTLQVPNLGEEITSSSLAEEEFATQDANYGHVSPLAEDDDYEHQEWTGGSSEKCNLIVNYLPHEIDDITLKVTTSTSIIYNCTVRYMPPTDPETTTRAHN